MRSIPPLAAVRVFEAAARHGNFTRAAEELGMTQAAVSYQIKLLEERLGAPVFARSGRGIALTDMGRRIAPKVTGAFDALDEAFASVRTETESVLTISAPTSFAANWLAGRLGGFQLTRPGLAVRLLVEDALIDFSRGDADVAIRGGVYPPWPGLAQHFVMRMPIAPYASPGLIAAHPPVRAAADLLAMPRLADDHWWPLWFRAAGVDAPEELGGGVRFDSQVLMGNAAVNGHGVALLTPMMWEPQVASGQLVRLWSVAAYWRAGFWLVYPENKRNQPKVRAFRDWLLEEVRRAAGEDPDGVLTPPELDVA
ncbi:LysR substrate-binding domain-containing protein [Sphingomonas lenta]|uniref:LysR family transcriptional regulator n=1 Tax=Sphingomonas lenta TaxID=1141887 RepID=A0A2A2SBD7_9SPHN|nr:LysR substrate-binding domain-containing protein [Sphingomonas lenta]PAX06568.1 LysR family transcriptional regulator [Sphingomonas lenta]